MDEQDLTPTMSNALVTRCPRCKTSFRLTTAQLHTAKGVVRCGSCLHVFKAQDHLVGSAAHAAGRKAPAKPQKPTPARARPSAARRPATTAAKPPAPAMPERKPAPPPKSEPAAPPRAKPGPQTQANTPSAPPKAPERRDPSEDEDFLISDDMGKPENRYDAELSAEFMAMDGDTQQTRRSLFDREIQETQHESLDNADESWALSLLEEDDDDALDIHRDPRPQPSDSAYEPQGFTPVEKHTPTAATSTGEADSGITITGELTPVTQAKTQDFNLSHAPEDRAALISRIEAAPLELDWQPRRSARRFIWPGLCLLAVLLLLAQVAWLQFHSLSRMEPYRSLYAQICPWVGCTLPDLVDRQQIRAYNLLVRSHPDVDDALVVDAILLNQAGFEQPFPELALIFSDIQDNVLASRVFSPDEYLRGELTGRRLMPRNQSIHLTLEIVDPGPEAVNYRAYIPE